MSSTGDATRPRIEPLAPSRYRVEFTASAELKEKLGRAADLMRHTNPSGELSRDRRARAGRARGQARKGATRQGDAPECTSPEHAQRRRPRAVRREVFERDGERCTFVDESGRRCESRTWLELDHRIPRARGGPDDASNLAVVCRAHNRLAAEQQFGREHMDRAAGKRPAGGPAVDEKETPSGAATGAPPTAELPNARTRGRRRAAPRRRRAPQITRASADPTSSWSERFAEWVSRCARLVGHSGSSGSGERGRRPTRSRLCCAKRSPYSRDDPQKST